MPQWQAHGWRKEIDSRVAATERHAAKRNWFKVGRTIREHERQRRCW